jgi:hypothetical protein
LPSESVKALVIVTIGVYHEDSARVIVAAVGSRVVEFVAHQAKRTIGVFAIVMGFTKFMKQLEMFAVSLYREDHPVIRMPAVGCHTVELVTHCIT